MATKASKHPGLYWRGRYWWLTKDPVTGKPESTRCTTLAAARAVLAERERLAADPAYAASHAATISQQCTRFVALKRGSVTETTLDYMALKLGHFARVLGADMPLASVTPSAFDLYVSKRREEGAHDHTISKEVKIAIAMLRSAKRVGRFTGDLETLRPEYLRTSYVPRERAMTMTEVMGLLGHLRPDLAALLCLSVALGLRRSESLKLTPEDIDLDAGLVVVRGTKTKGSRRVVPVLSPFRGLLERALPHLPIGEVPNNLYRDLAVACRHAGIEKCGPNDWRRSHATILAELGAEAEQTRKLLGHSSTQMVDRIYARPKAEALGRLIEGAIERSAGVVDASSPEGSTELVATDKVAESLTAPYTQEPLPRPPKPKVSGSNPLGRAASTPTGEQQRSAGVAAVEIPALVALGYAAAWLGVLPANDTDPRKGVA